jgi:hypothetical protein
MTGGRSCEVSPEDDFVQTLIAGAWPTHCANRGLCRGPEFTLDRNGFTLIKAPTAVRNFSDGH